MIIGGGSGPQQRYYVCPASRRGRCEVRSYLRVEVAEDRILGAFRDRLLQGGADQIRKLLAQRLGELSRNADAELKERRARLDRTQKRIANFLEAFAEGERSPSLSRALSEAEAEAAAGRQAIAETERLGNKPIRLLSPEEVTRKISHIGALVKADPIAAREELRRCLHEGKIRVYETPQKAFVARAEVLGEIFLMESPEMRMPVRGTNLGRACIKSSSGGRLCPTFTIPGSTIM